MHSQDQIRTLTQSSIDVVIVDPPRAGMGEQGARDLANLQPPRIVYVSCNPSTLARDVSWLASMGGYELKDVTCVDMFPNTPHVECVALLERSVSV